MSREPMEAKASMPLQRGSCDFCGRTTAEDRTYCGKECRVAYNNLLARQGKSVMQMLKVWRKHRGARGTPGDKRGQAQAAFLQSVRGFGGVGGFCCTADDFAKLLLDADGN